MTLGLRLQLFVPVMVLLLLTLFLSTWFAWQSALQADLDFLAEQQSVAQSLIEPPYYPITPQVLEKLKRLSGAEIIFTRAGTVVTSTLPAVGDVPESDRLLHNNRSYLLTSTVLPANHPSAGAVVFFAYPEEQKQLLLRQAVRTPLILGTSVLILALVMLALTGRMVQRIRAVQQAAQHLGTAAFAPLNRSTPADELNTLGLAINAVNVRLCVYEVQLKQSERLRVLGHVSGGLAHQLRNAASGARLAIQLIPSSTSPEIHEPLNVALRQLTRMEQLLRQFLTLGQADPEARQTVDLVAILDQAVQLAIPHCQHIGTALIWHKPPPILLDGYPEQLGHLFGNLLANAIEAAGQQGTVTVRCQREPMLTVEISDTGPGLPPEIAAHLFEPFVTGKPQGIGLGLAVAQQAADQHRATLDWRRDGDQTHFRVIFPPAAMPSVHPGHPRVQETS